MATHKDIQTKRGLTYHYLTIQSQTGKPTIVLLHGFPSSPRDWRFQIDYFSAKGYGLVVPDMLGYGRTDKPLDVKYYSWQDMATDILEIIEAEALENVIVVGHDWSVLAPCLSQIAPISCHQPHSGVPPSYRVWPSFHPIVSLDSHFSM
jgi:soluble epoxide hydrolase/lipid-phosphate phosphatase